MIHAIVTSRIFLEAIEVGTLESEQFRVVIIYAHAITHVHVAVTLSFKWTFSFLRKKLLGFLCDFST